MDPNILLFSCNGNIDFSKKVATHLNLDLGLCEINKFANYEIQINIHLEKVTHTKNSGFSYLILARFINLIKN